MKRAFVIAILPVVLLYLLLSFKNPFSTRSLIPNLEPYPDTLFISIPAYNFATGKGYALEAYGQSIKQIVPPLYSVVLIAGFAIFGDIRAYYFVNLLLGVLTLVILLAILRRHIRKDKQFLLSALAVGSLYATSYYVYTLPSLLMAENLSLLLATYSLYWLLARPEKKQTAWISWLGLTLLLTKFALYPLVIFLYAAHGLLLLLKKDWQLIRFYVLHLVAAGVVLAQFIFKSQILSDHVNLQSGQSFDWQLLPKNAWWYVQSLLGNTNRFLWYQEFFLTLDIAIASGAGLLLALNNKKYRKLAVLLLTGTVTQILLMSSFYYTDSRYLITALPFIFTGLGLGISAAVQTFKLKPVLTALLIWGGIHLLVIPISPSAHVPKAISLKQQLGLNFKHAQTPWNYLAVQHFNQHITSKDAYLGTFLPPFYVSVFSEEHYRYLPISSHQEFSTTGKDFMSPYLFNLPPIEVYEQLVTSGAEVYVSDYYLANSRAAWEPAWKELELRFDLELVAPGCEGVCNLYRVQPKNSP